MKVRAYLAKDNHLVPSEDSDHYIDYDIMAIDPEQIQELCGILFPGEVEYLDHFSESSSLREYLKRNDIIFHNLVWQGPGSYLLWQRIVYKSEPFLKREIRFMIRLEENLKTNSSGKTDRLFHPI